MEMYTDQTIPIQCAACPQDHVEEGLVAMVVHILKTHKTYSPLEANEYAMRWMDDAYDVLDSQQERMTEQWRRDHGHCPVPRGIA